MMDGGASVCLDRWTPIRTPVGQQRTAITRRSSYVHRNTARMGLSKGCEGLRRSPVIEEKPWGRSCPMGQYNVHMRFTVSALCCFASRQGKSVESRRTPTSESARATTTNPQPHFAVRWSFGGIMETDEEEASLLVIVLDADPRSWRDMHGEPAPRLSSSIGVRAQSTKAVTDDALPIVCICSEWEWGERWREAEELDDAAQVARHIAGQWLPHGVLWLSDVVDCL